MGMSAKYFMSCEPSYVAIHAKAFAIIHLANSKMHNFKGFKTCIATFLSSGVSFK